MAEQQRPATEKLPMSTECISSINPIRNSKMEAAPDDEALSKLVEAANSFAMNDDISSKFKTPNVKYRKFSPKNLIKKMAVTEPDSSVCARDVHFLIKFYLHSTSESRYDATSEGHDECINLMKKYGIHRKADDDNLTLNRIAASFPIVAVSIMRQCKIDRRFTTLMLQKKNAGEFPWSMRTQMCLSLVPSGSLCQTDNRKIVLAIIAYMYYENMIVNDVKKNVPSKPIFGKVLNIAQTVCGNSHVDEDKKKIAWNHVVYDYNAHRASVDSLLEHFRSEIPDAETVFVNRFELRPAKSEQVGRKTQSQMIWRNKKRNHCK